MKQITILLLTTLFLCPAMAQNSKNSRADAIVGTFRVEHAGQQSKVRVYKEKNGDYTAQCIWLRDSIDPATGKLITDSKNPDKSLRNTPCNRIIIFRNMQYNSKKQRWEDGKIYDPTRGKSFTVNIWFDNANTLCVKGSFGPFSEKVYWKKLE